VCLASNGQISEHHRSEFPTEDWFRPRKGGEYLSTTYLLWNQFEEKKEDIIKSDVDAVGDSVLIG
jgi:hypothetical protein